MYNTFVNILKKGVIQIMYKEKFSNLPINVFGYSFHVYYVKDNNTFWYEIIATKDDNEYYVCKLDYAKTFKGIRTFLLNEIAKDLKEKYNLLNIKVFKNSIKLNDKLFTLKKQKTNNDFSPIYDIKIELIQHIIELRDKNVLVA